MTKLIALMGAGLVLLAACVQAPAPRPPARPLRVVSLDYCADQYVLRLVDRGRIVAVSPDAAKPFSYMRAAATGLRRVPAKVEDVLVLRPDLVVRSYGGGPDAARFLTRAGVPVLQVGYAEDIAGVRRTLIEMADGLGEAERGRRLAAEMDSRLARLRRHATAASAFYMTPGGVTTGPGTLVHEMLMAAGLRNFQREQGWRPLPLERLAYERPDLVAAAFFDVGTGPPDRWSAARHPVARAQLRDRPVVPLEGAWTTCGGWFVLDAVEALARRPQ